MSGTGKNPREITIKLLCPSLSKMTQVVWEDQRMDLGSISRAFGLDPSTLRLNGHFISRGVDLIASSLTWNSLLSFFSSKDLPTGRDQCDALLVTGKLCKVGLKREILKGQSCKRKELLEDVNLFKKLKIDEDKSDIGDKIDDHSGSIARNQFTCSYASKNLKRIREDEAIVAANYKRIR
ncbi:uncharacterized protein LOC108330408 [Vigna angularis]|uniref:uncharacterized protein LOC108330408 n=1 Tax=Phaseolus angularis TaxID=3914 RepID=UPI0022B43B03|nr:uncharacterized protein LOC108330408 [Vigna angularis]